MWFPNTSDTNQAAQSQKHARSLKFRIKVEEEVYYPCSVAKTKALISFAYADYWFSHEAAHFLNIGCQCVLVRFYS